MVSSENIITAISNVLPRDFEIEITEQNYLHLKYQNTNRILVIVVGKVLNGVLEGLGAGISFIEVESIIHMEFKHMPYFNNGATLDTRQHGLIFDKKIGSDVFNQLPISLDTDFDLVKANALIKKFINEDAIPFFNYWDDVRVFLPYIETDDLSKINEYVFSGYGTEKKLVIWRLCNHPNYESFKNYMVDKITQALVSSPNDRGYKDFIKLTKKLEKVKPLYEWDEKYLIPKALPA